MLNRLWASLAKLKYKSQKLWSADLNFYNKYIFYKIVNQHKNKFLIHCITTDVFFYMTLQEIIDDLDILYGLHPLQASFIGLEYAQILQSPTKLVDVFLKKNNPHAFRRYGNCYIHYQDEYGKICFTDTSKYQNFSLPPCEIVKNGDLISQFDSAQAFYIGALAGFSLKEPVAAT
ncbi:MAG: hypothetical protein Tsb005_17340 [Gammaproteobacteria bacterium]